MGGSELLCLGPLPCRGTRLVAMGTNQDASLFSRTRCVPGARVPGALSVVAKVTLNVGFISWSSISLASGEIWEVFLRISR